MKVRIPTPLYSYTGNQTLVEGSGSTVGQVTQDLDQKFPGIRFRIIDEQDRIRPHIKIFINQDQIFDLTKAVTASDEIVIIQAFSGG